MKKTESELARLLKNAHMLSASEYTAEYHRITKRDLKARMHRLRRIKINR